MRISRIGAMAAIAATAAAAAVPAVAPGQGNRPPRNAAVTLDVRPTTIVFGEAATLRGRLSNTQPEAGVTIRAEADDTRPYGDSYRNSGVTTRTGPSGNFTVEVKPAVNTQYQVVAQASPPVTSGARLVVVRPRVGLIVSDSTPRRGRRVGFSGSVAPAHDGAVALIQRQTSAGRFATVARTTLRDAGETLSRYSRRVRVRRDGVYRVKVAGHDDHVNGFSRERRLDVHG